MKVQETLDNRIHRHTGELYGHYFRDCRADGTEPMTREQWRTMVLKGLYENNKELYTKVVNSEA